MFSVQSILGSLVLLLLLVAAPVPELPPTTANPTAAAEQPSQTVAPAPTTFTTLPISMLSFVDGDNASPDSSPSATASPTTPPATATATPTTISSATPTATSTPTAASSPTSARGLAPPSPPPAGQRQLRLPIFMYHYIRVNPDPADRIGYNLSVTPADFAGQMESLAARGYQAIGLEEVAGYLLGTRPAPPARSVVLTFDDGYSDAYTAAFPVLKKHGFRATIFMITGLIGRPGYLSWPQLKELSGSGITIGSHTVNHPDLTKLGKQDLAHQLGESKAVLERELGRPVQYFCYPSGQYNSSVLEAVAAAGYEAAVTVNYGLVHRQTDRLTLSRVRISGGQSFASIASSAGLETAPAAANPAALPASGAQQR